MKHLLRCLALTGLMGLIGCSQLERKPSADAVGASAAPQVSILFTSARHLSLTPCGCSLLPLGGVDREWNFSKGWRASAAETKISLSAGTSFLPLTFQYNAKKNDVYFNSAKLLVEAWNSLSLSAIGPSAEDTRLGIGKLRALEALAKFPFVSTNLYQKKSRKPLFKKFLVVPANPAQIVVFALSHGFGAKVRTGKDVVVRDPVSSLREVMKEIPAGPRVLVVLSSLSKAQRLKLAASVTEPLIILGGDETDVPSIVQQVSTTSIYLNPANRGRAVARLDLEISNDGVAKKFYNYSISSEADDSKMMAAKSLGAIEKKLTAKLSRVQRSELLAQKKKWEQEYERAALIANTGTAPYLGFKASVTSLDADFGGDSTPLTEIVSKARVVESTW